MVRLWDRGCDAFDVADARLGVLAQRLCQWLCISCKEASPPGRQECDELAKGAGSQDRFTFGIEDRAEWRLSRE